MKTMWPDAPIASGEILGKVVPYMRMTQKTKWSDAAKRYLSSQDDVVKSLEAGCKHLPDVWRACRRCKGRRHLKGRKNCPACKATGKEPFKVVTPWRLGVAVWVPPTKAGELPKNAGDYDNIFKALADAAVRGRIVVDDSLFWFRGPAPIAADGFPSGAYVATDGEWRLQWALWEAVELERSLQAALGV